MRLYLLTYILSRAVAGAPVKVSGVISYDFRLRWLARNVPTRRGRVRPETFNCLYI